MSAVVVATVQAAAVEVPRPVSAGAEEEEEGALRAQVRVRHSPICGIAQGQQWGVSE